MLNGNYDLVKGLDKESKRTFKQAQLDFLKGLKNGKIATSWYHRPVCAIFITECSGSTNSRLG